MEIGLTLVGPEAKGCTMRYGNDNYAAVDQHMAGGDGLDNGFESQFVSICPCGDGLANGFKSRWVSICPSGDGLTNGFESRWVSICPL